MRQQTELLFAKNHEAFFNAIDPNATSAAQNRCLSER
jgi:hypothetical protein